MAQTALPGCDPVLVTYRFGEFEVDVGAWELRRGGHRLPLARQPMDLLLLLLERRQELVANEDITRRLWAPNVVTDFEAGIRTAILKIRQVLDDSRESPGYVQTVAGKGYRFVSTAEVLAEPEYRRGTSRHNLPADLTSFVGRRKELLALPGVLASTRLLSLTGA